MRSLTALALLCLPTISSAQGPEVGFLEEFALATDRSAALSNLIPGSKDAYFYRCLHAQNSGDFAQVPTLLDAWVERHGRDERVEEIENRQALLNIERDPARTFDFLIRRLGLRFDHRQEGGEGRAELASRLDANLLELSSLIDRARRAHHDSLAGFEDSMLPSLASAPLSDRQLNEYLERLQRPDVPGLVNLIVRQLDLKGSRAFGALEIHKRLVLDQLEACVSLRPTLLNEPDFVAIYLKRLLPSNDVDWRRNPEEREAYLVRLKSFADRLSPAHNGLKAHVLQHRLRHDLTQGRPSRDRLLEFLRLPRRSSYVNPEHLARKSQREIVDSPANDLTALGPAGSDEALVRTYLEHFFQSDNSWDAFSEYVHQDYLRRVFAETKILAGVGDMERWYTLLNDSEYYEALQERVEIEFPATQTTRFAPREAVALDVDTKNVGTLLVKVFEIDALAYALDHETLVDASIDLDGLVAATETTYEYDEPALRRVRRRFEFPSIDHAGVYVIDFIAGGLSSRAVIHKGGLQLRERLGSAGHVFTVTDDGGRRLEAANLYLDGRRFSAEDGEIVVPFAGESSRRNVVIESGRLVSVESFDHHVEEYRLLARAYVDREALLAGGTAQLILRSRLEVHGALCDIQLLENPVLTLTAYTVEGTRTSLDVRELELTSDREWLHEFRVPNRLYRLEVGLRGEVENLSLGETQTVVSPTQTFFLNRIDNTASVEAPILGRDSEGYFLDVLGRNGEARAGRIVDLELSVAGFRDPLRVQLQTDARGRVELGELPRVRSLRAPGLTAGGGSWELVDRQGSRHADLHGLKGEVLRLPYHGSQDRLGRGDVSLLELRGDQYSHDRFAQVSLRNGFVELRDLPAGDFDLFLSETQERVAVKIIEGRRHGEWAVGRDHALELRRPALQVVRSEVEADSLQIEVAGSSPRTRVHVFGTRYLPSIDAYENLTLRAEGRLRDAALGRLDSTYHSGREIGEEYRYILERRFAKKYPGNMLERPGLLLNPWALFDSNTIIGVGGGTGGRFGGSKRLKAAGGVSEDGRDRFQGAESPATFANLDFLARPAVQLANLRLDDQGRLSLPLADLEGAQELRILVIDDEESVETRVQQAPTPLVRRDRRIARPLDPTRHVAEQRRIEFKTAGERVTLRDSTTVESQTYESLADVFQLFRTLNPESELAQFDFLLEWPELDAERKRELYSKFACHELHLFLHEKDSEFFAEVVAPYLEFKADKTFLDHWLLGDDLTPFLEPWAFGRLNTVERILLGRRIDSARQSIARDLRERLELAPTRLEEQERYDGMFFLGAELQLTERRKNKESGPSSPGPSGPAEDKAAFQQPTLEQEKDADFDSMPEAAKRDADRRANARSLFTGPRPTEQFVEHNWWHTAIQGQVASLINVDQFWLDLAESDPAQAFRSANFVQCAGNIAEMISALAFLDLPFQAADHEFSSEGDKQELIAAGPLLVVRREIAAAETATAANGLLVGQEYFDLQNRFRFEGEKRIELRVENEFVRGVPYACRIVVTNPGSEALELNLLQQIPAGSQPLKGDFETRSVPVQLGPYSTYTNEYSFYFPAAGDWAHFPAHVGLDGQHLAAAEGRVLHVVPEPTTVDTTSWEYISQRASLEQLVDYLKTANLGRLDLGRIAWRLQERESYDRLLELLRARHHFDATLWAYGFRHRDNQAVREYLPHANHFVARTGPWLASPVLDIDPVERHAWQRIEFRPLINARAHPVGDKREIANRELGHHYAALLAILAHKPTLDDSDWMSVTYQLLLQDRIEEALESFARVEPTQLAMRIQYDYMRAYLDFFSDDPSLAGAIADSYRAHPVPRWRERFAEIRAHLDESAGRASGAEAGTQASDVDHLAATEPTLELELEGGRATLHHRDLESCELRFYVMDVEFLFSTSPFVQQGSGSFGYVKPSRSQRMSLESGEGRTTFDLPAEFRSANVIVEARANGLVRRQAHFANSLNVQVIESYGQIKVTDAETGRPLSKAYVKIFADHGGSPRFHKDGYTDLRGRFDYASVSGLDLQGIERFAILVLDEEKGAVIREVKPPAQ